MYHEHPEIDCCRGHVTIEHERGPRGERRTHCPRTVSSAPPQSKRRHDSDLQKRRRCHGRGQSVFPRLSGHQPVYYFKIQ